LRARQVEHIFRANGGAHAAKRTQSAAEGWVEYREAPLTMREHAFGASVHACLASGAGLGDAKFVRPRRTNRRGINLTFAGKQSPARPVDLILGGRGH